MPPKKKADAPAAEPPPPPERPPGFVACTTDEHELIVDPKGWCHLPYDTAHDGVKSFRAIVVPRGKTARVSPANYVVVGCSTVITAPVLVHFTNGRAPEVLLDFVDYAMVKDSLLTGVSVETLKEPLMVRKGVYQTQQYVVSLRHVAGFSSFPPGAPYTVHLEPALKKNAPYSTLNISSVADVMRFVDTPLAGRVSQLMADAEQRYEKAAAELSKAGDRQAQKTRGVWEAQLLELVGAVRAMPLKAYDERLSARFTHLTSAEIEHSQPGLLSSPLREQLSLGTAELKRTALRPKSSRTSGAAGRSSSPIQPVPDEEEAEAAAPDSAQSPPPRGKARAAPPSAIPSRARLADDPSDSEKSESAPSTRGKPPAAVPRGGRKRKQTDIYEPPMPAAAAKKQQAAKPPPKSPAKQEEGERLRALEKANKQAGRQLHKAMGLKPDGRPYKRGPYNKNKLTGAQVTAGAALTTQAAAAAKTMDELIRENSTLKDKLADSEREVSKLRGDLAAEKKEVASLVREAKASVREECAQKMENQFMKGAAFASRVASGGVFEYTPSALGSATETPS
jgi:hypothetical protein